MRNTRWYTNSIAKSGRVQVTFHWRDDRNLTRFDSVRACHVAEGHDLAVCPVPHDVSRSDVFLAEEPFLQSNFI